MLVGDLVKFDTLLAISVAVIAKWDFDDELQKSIESKVGCLLGYSFLLLGLRFLLALKMVVRHDLRRNRGLRSSISVVDDLKKGYKVSRNRELFNKVCGINCEQWILLFQDRERH